MLGHRPLTGANVYARQVARPASDVSAGGWFPSSGSDLAPMIDEVTRDDSDLIYTTTPGATFKVRFSTVTNPQTGKRSLVYAAAAPYGGTLCMALYNGSTLIEEWCDTLTPDLRNYSHTPSEPVPNWAALDLWGTALAP